jgi:hypothetical protein
METAREAAASGGCTIRDQPVKMVKLVGCNL